jgi:hypothetical protein
VIEMSLPAPLISDYYQRSTDVTLLSMILRLLSLALPSYAFNVPLISKGRGQLWQNNYCHLRTTISSIVL